MRYRVRASLNLGHAVCKVSDALHIGGWSARTAEGESAASKSHWLVGQIPGHHFRPAPVGLVGRPREMAHPIGAEAVEEPHMRRAKMASRYRADGGQLESAMLRKNFLIATRSLCPCNRRAVRAGCGAASSRGCSTTCYVLGEACKLLDLRGGPTGEMIGHGHCIVRQVRADTSVKQLRPHG